MPLKLPRSLLNRGIFQDRRAVSPVEKFTDEGPADIVLINRAKRSWDETPQQGKKPWGVRIASNDAGAKNRQTPKSETPHHIFFFTHDAGISDPAPGAAPSCRKKSESFHSGRQATTRKGTDQADFQLSDVLYAPLLTPFADADTGCGIYRFTLSAAGPGEFGDSVAKTFRAGIHDDLAQPHISSNGSRPPIHHHHFRAGAGSEQRPHEARTDLPGATDDQNAKAHALPFSE
jgi:hypothetical protein